MLAQRAERSFVGVECGIMDQFISVFGMRNHALLLDCRTLDYQYVSLPRRAQLVICNSHLERTLGRNVGLHSLDHAIADTNVPHPTQLLARIEDFPALDQQVELVIGAHRCAGKQR